MEIFKRKPFQVALLVNQAIKFGNTSHLAVYHQKGRENDEEFRQMR